MADDNLFGLGSTVAENPSNEGAQGVQEFGVINQALTEFETSLNSGGLLNGNGPLESAIFGSPQDAAAGNITGVQNLIRGISGASSEELTEGRAARTRLVAEDFLNAYEGLKGAGQITEFESRSAAAAQTLFGNPDASDEQIQTEITRLRDTAEGGNYRNLNGITIDNNGIETLTDENGTRNVLTYRNEQGGFEHTDVPDGRTIYNIPDWISEENAKDMVTGLPSGSEYFYQGQIYNRDNM